MVIKKMHTILVYGYLLVAVAVCADAATYHRFARSPENFPVRGGFSEASSSSNARTQGNNGLGFNSGRSGSSSSANAQASSVGGGGFGGSSSSASANAQSQSGRLGGPGLIGRQPGIGFVNRPGYYGGGGAYPGFGGGISSASANANAVSVGK